MFYLLLGYDKTLMRLPLLKTSLLILLTTLIISACSDRDPHRRYKVRTRLMTFSYDTALIWDSHFTYDAQGRLILQEVNDSAHFVKISYHGDTVTYHHSDEGLGTSQLILDRRGYAVRSFDGSICEYDSSGYCVHISWPDGRSKSLTVKDGDIVMRTEYQGDSVTNRMRSVYYPELDLSDDGTRFFGKSSMHLLHYNIYGKAEARDTVEFTYTFDKYGRVLTETHGQVGQSMITRSAYTYFE